MDSSMNTFEQIIEGFRNMAKSIAEAYSKYLEPLREIFRSMSETIETITSGFLEIAQPFRAINKLAQHQYVYWEDLNDEFVFQINETNNLNRTLREINEKQQYRNVNDIINHTKEHQYLSPYKKLYLQATEAFKLGYCEIAVLGYVSVTDGLLTEVSKADKQIVSIYKRADEILKKVENSIKLTPEEFKVFILTYTLRETMQTFSTNQYKFDDPEPKILNRHWIMHGRSLRRKTKLDCVKMIRFIYGIILLDEIAQQYEKEVA